MRTQYLLHHRFVYAAMYFMKNFLTGFNAETIKLLINLRFCRVITRVHDRDQYSS